MYTDSKGNAGKGKINYGRQETRKVLNRINTFVSANTLNSHCVKLRRMWIYLYYLGYLTGLDIKGRHNTIKWLKSITNMIWEQELLLWKAKLGSYHNVIDRIIISKTFILYTIYIYIIYYILLEHATKLPYFSTWNYTVLHKSNFENIGKLKKNWTYILDHSTHKNKTKPKQKSLNLTSFPTVLNILSVVLKSFKTLNFRTVASFHNEEL